MLMLLLLCGLDGIGIGGLSLLLLDELLLEELLLELLDELLLLLELDDWLCELDVLGWLIESLEELLLIEGMLGWPWLDSSPPIMLSLEDCCPLFELRLLAVVPLWLEF